VIDLIERGVITNARKAIMPGKIAATFAYGTRRMYAFINDNPMFRA
jgi:acyl-CoA hydrolase